MLRNSSAHYEITKLSVSLITSLHSWNIAASALYMASNSWDKFRLFTDLIVQFRLVCTLNIYFELHFLRFSRIQLSRWWGCERIRYDYLGFIFSNLGHELYLRTETSAFTGTYECSGVSESENLIRRYWSRIVVEDDVSNQKIHSW